MPVFLRTRSTSSRRNLLRCFALFCIRSLMASSKIVSEYAKSNRSSCKKCGGTISVSTLRLGLMSGDARGFGMMKWHHLNCFPTDSLPIVSGEKINGFSLLRSSDREALKQLVARNDRSQTEGSDEVEEGAETSDKDSIRELKVRKADTSGLEEHRRSDSKKSKIASYFAISILLQQLPSPDPV